MFQFVLENEPSTLHSFDHYSILEVTLKRVFVFFLQIVLQTQTRVVQAVKNLTTMQPTV